MLLLGAAGGVVASAAWHGPVVLSLSSDHGIHTGDLLVFPSVVLAIALVRGRFAATGASRRWAVPASAVVLGALLLLAGVVPKSGGGPLVPAAGGTFDGTIRRTSAGRPVSVNRWSNVALTYDGAVLRLYVNGREVSSRATTGRIQTLANPVWIGGNRPYGEHFDGLIDEVRVYNRALSAEEIRHDMDTPVAPTAGLVAAYGFDAGSGTTAEDSSGDDNAGEIRGATWARGRYGGALRFDGVSTVVRVPASPSLTLTRAMTLSGWIRPSAPQTGWRTIVQRQVDEYFLAAGSDRQNRSGLVDDARAALLVAAAVWFCVVIAIDRGPRATARRRWWWVPVALFTVGSLVDAALAPSGTLIGPALVALWLAATSSGLVEPACFLLGATACIGLTIASLTAVGGVDVALARDDGAIARTAALGALFVLAGLAARRSSSLAPATRP